mgnify:CR=1 FL=1
MDMQVVPKIGISSVVHSKHIDPDSIDVVGNDIALFDTESVISLYNGPSKLEVVSIGLCLEGSTRFNISLREFEQNGYCVAQSDNRTSSVQFQFQRDFLCCIKKSVGIIAQSW